MLTTHRRDARDGLDHGLDRDLDHERDLDPFPGDPHVIPSTLTSTRLYFVDAVLRRCKYSNASIGLQVQQRFNGVIPYRRALLSFLTRLAMIAGGGHRIADGIADGIGR